jgi:hypothetical protein
MLIVSPEFKCSNEMLTITAMMSGTPLHQELPFFANFFFSNSAKRVDTAQQPAKRRGRC